MVKLTGASGWIWVSSVSFRSASTHIRSPIRPTALVVVKADSADITSVPGWSESTSLTVPAKGARTVA